MDTQSNIEINSQTIIMLLPPIDNHTETVEVAYWLKKNGSHVQKDEPLCEIETEEFSFELSASDSGILKIVAENGTTIKIGDIVCEIILESKE